MKQVVIGTAAGILDVPPLHQGVLQVFHGPEFSVGRLRDCPQELLGGVGFQAALEFRALFEREFGIIAPQRPSASPANPAWV